MLVGQLAIRTDYDTDEVTVTLVDGPKLLALDSPVRPYLGRFGHVFEVRDPTAPCASDKACLATRKRKYTQNGAAPEVRGWCDAKERTCRPVSAKTHGYDLGAREWALPFLRQRAVNHDSKAALATLCRKLTKPEPDGRPTFAEAIAFLDEKTRAIVEPEPREIPRVRP